MVEQSMDNNEWPNDEEDEGDGDTFKYNEDIERFLENPDAIIAFYAFRYIFKVEPGHITDDSIAHVEEIIRHAAIDYEYPFHGMDVTNDRIEVKVEISVTESALEGAEVFQKRLKCAGIGTELVYVETIGKQ
jgi:hypothetical protein